MNDGRAIMHASRNQGKGEHRNWPAIYDLSGDLVLQAVKQ